MIKEFIPRLLLFVFIFTTTAQTSFTRPYITERSVYTKPENNKVENPKTLTLQQQKEDFSIFKRGLQEGHNGLYYYIDKNTFDKKCDSVEATFIAGDQVDNYYLKLRYLLALTSHGHAGIRFEGQKPVSYRMAVLRNDKQYLPLELTISDNKVYVLQDGSSEQAIPKGAQILRINGVAVKNLLETMLPYLFADGRNTTFKYYFLYNYYYFHYLYGMLYPSQKGFTLEIAGKKGTIHIKARSPGAIEETLQRLSKENKNSFKGPLDYQPAIAKKVAYLKVGSFYKGYIENFGKSFEPFIDSVFSDLKRQDTEKLILDLRNNEGGGDGYNDYLFARLSEKEFTTFGFDNVAGKSFSSAKYTIDLREDLKAFMEDPKVFLRDDTSLILKEEYIDGQKTLKPAKNVFNGPLYVLINGGTFSAGNIMVRYLYNYRQTTNRPIYFIGEENGGDIYSNVQCAGVGYTFKLPNSEIRVDVPFLCEGIINKTEPAKRLPDFQINPSFKDIQLGKDTVLEYTLELISKKQVK